MEILIPLKTCRTKANKKEKRKKILIILFGLNIKYSKFYLDNINYKYHLKNYQFFLNILYFLLVVAKL